MMRNLYPEYPVLVVDDEPRVLESLEMALCSEGFSNLRLQSNPLKVLDDLEKETFDAVLLDVIMPQLSGENLLVRIMERRPDLPVIMVTGVDDVKMALSCTKNGAFDYLLKPVRNEDLAASLRRALQVRKLRRENIRLGEKLLSADLEHPEAFSQIVTRDPAMNQIFRYCEAVAGSQEPLLITGETGTGKELFARVAHELSGRTGKFVAVNIAGLDDQAFSDTLFGHMRGAFTGAERNRPGFLEKAAGGTLFLDEIGDLSQTSQIRLLRVLQEREFYPLGSDVPRPLQTRLVTATNRKPGDLRKAEVFRSDFYFRINTHHIHLPPLRERKEDIPLLFQHFLSQAAETGDREIPYYSPQVLEKLLNYDYPGNVRELRALVFDAVVSQQGEFTVALPMASYPSTVEVSPEESCSPQNGFLRHLDPLPTLKDANQMFVEEAMRRSEGNQRAAASLLGITPQALSSRLKRAKG